MQGLDQQLAAAFQQSRPGRQATGKVFVEQGEIAHQGVETTEPRGRIQLAVGQAPEATAARRAGEFDQFRRGVDADAFADLAGQRPAQPALAAADIQQAPRRALAQRLENRVVGGQAAAFQASLAHGAGPGLGIAAPAALEPSAALHGVSAGVRGSGGRGRGRRA